MHFNDFPLILVSKECIFITSWASWCQVSKSETDFHCNPEKKYFGKIVTQNCVLFSADCTVEEISRLPDSVSRDQNPETTQLDDGFVEARRPLSFNKPIPQVRSSPKSIFVSIKINLETSLPVLSCFPANKQKLSKRHWLQRFYFLYYNI